MSTVAETSAGIAAMTRQLENIDPPIPMLVLERGLLIRWVSRAALEQFGVRPELLIGRTWYEIFPHSATRRAQHEELFRGTCQSFDLPRIPLQLQCSSIRFFAIRLRPIRSPDGSIEALLGIGEDVTAQVQTEATLRDSERRLEIALWSSKAAYWTIRVSDDRAEMSSQFFELTGIAESEWRLDRHPWNDRMHLDDRPRARRIYEDFIAGRTDLYECEYRLLHPGGWLWLHDRGRVVERDVVGRAVVMAGTSQDASARKSLEIALTGAAEREQRRLSQDLHDGLGQELAGIHYLLSAVAHRLRHADRSEAADVEQVLALTRGAMDSTRSMAHGLAAAALRPGGLKFALSALATEVSKRYGIHVSCVGDDSNPSAMSDETAQNLFRISQEAVTNARRHGGGSDVSITMHRVGAFFELTIADNGCGMPLPPNGTGIGLKIMAYRAQTIGASFTIAPRAGGGTQIVVRCPERL